MQYADFMFIIRLDTHDTEPNDPTELNGFNRQVCSSFGNALRVRQT